MLGHEISRKCEKGEGEGRFGFAGGAANFARYQSF